MRSALAITVALYLTLASAAGFAHKRWLLPTDFNLSDTETVTVDFTASNNIFYVDKPMPLTGVSVSAPDGAPAPLLDTQEGARRSSFDLQVEKPGTYRVSAVPPPVYFVSYRMPGKKDPVVTRGPLQKLKAELPAEAELMGYAEAVALIETFITLGGESDPAPAPGGAGLVLQVLDHPSTLYADEPARFRFLLDGAPAAALPVSVIPEGTRYRDGQNELNLITDASGEVEIQWPGSGRYLLEAATEQDRAGADVGKRYFSYFLTLEVLAP